MTANQIAAAKALEERRHNIEMEKFNAGNLTELSRHNLATEEYATGNLQESRRHNISSENLSAYSLTESQRHNIATETVADKGLAQQYASLTAQVDHWLNQDNIANLNQELQEALASWKQSKESVELAISEGRFDMDQNSRPFQDMNEAASAIDRIAGVMGKIVGMAGSIMGFLGV